MIWYPNSVIVLPKLAEKYEVILINDGSHDGSWDNDPGDQPVNSLGSWDQYDAQLWPA